MCEVLDALLGAVGLIDVYACVGVGNGFGRILGHGIRLSTCGAVQAFPWCTFVAVPLTSEGVEAPTEKPSRAANFSTL